MNEQVWNLKIRHEIQRKRKYWNMNCPTNQAQRIYRVAFAPFQFLAPIAILAYSFARILKVMRPNLRGRYQMRSALHLILWMYSAQMSMTMVVKDPKRNLLSWNYYYHRKIENGFFKKSLVKHEFISVLLDVTFFHFLLTLHEIFLTLHEIYLILHDILLYFQFFTLN